ncbi:MAG: Panacea domain-containing protein [Parcubacteria group bacterium]
MTIPLPKLKAIIKYFCANTNPDLLGKTKLMKLFYFLDFSHIKKCGTSVTGDTYYNLEFGPIPTMIKNLVDLSEEKPESSLLSDVMEVQCKDGQEMHKIVCGRDFTKKDEEYFSPLEFETLANVCKRFKDYSTEQIVNASHQEAPWLKTRQLEKISYELAADDPDCLVRKEDIQLMSKI